MNHDGLEYAARDRARTAILVAVEEWTGYPEMAEVCARMVEIADAIGRGDALVAGVVACGNVQGGAACFLTMCHAGQCSFPSHAPRAVERYEPGRTRGRVCDCQHADAHECIVARVTAQEGAYDADKHVPSCLCPCHQEHAPKPCGVIRDGRPCVRDVGHEGACAAAPSTTSFA